MYACTGQTALRECIDERCSLLVEIFKSVSAQIPLQYADVGCGGHPISTVLTRSQPLHTFRRFKMCIPSDISNFQSHFTSTFFNVTSVDVLKGFSHISALKYRIGWRRAEMASRLGTCGGELATASIGRKPSGPLRFLRPSAEEECCSPPQSRLEFRIPARRFYLFTQSHLFTSLDYTRTGKLDSNSTRRKTIHVRRNAHTSNTSNPQYTPATHTTYADFQPHVTLGGCKPVIIQPTLFQSIPRPLGCNAEAT